MFPNPDGNGFVLHMRDNLLDGLNTRIVVPHIMVTQFMAAVPVALLQAPVTSLVEHDVEIGNAMDMLFVGY